MSTTRKLVWRKLASDPTPEWQQLPILTRGVADEIMRRLDPDNGIDCSESVEPYEAICMVTGAHPRERRRVRDAIDELVRGRWLVLSGRRWLAYFPDLGTTRPSVERAAPGRDRASTEHRPNNPPTTQAPTDASNVANTLDTHIGAISLREEERRGEKRREEERRAPDLRPTTNDQRREQPEPEPPRDLANVVRAKLADTLRAAGRPVPPLDTSSKCQRVAEWCRDHALATGATFDDVLDALARGFASASGRTAKAGWPMGYLVANPGEYIRLAPSNPALGGGETDEQLLADLRRMA